MASSNPLSVSTSPVQGAACTLHNSEGTWYLTSPGSVEVHKTKNDLEVTCTKDGYQPGKQVATSKFGGATFGNILAGGVIGVGIDAASGANYYYDNPLTVPLGTPTVTPASTNDASCRRRGADAQHPCAGETRPSEPEAFARGGRFRTGFERTAYPSLRSGERESGDGGFENLFAVDLPAGICGCAGGHHQRQQMFGGGMEGGQPGRFPIASGAWRGRDHPSRRFRSARHRMRPMAR